MSGDDRPVELASRLGTPENEAIIHQVAVGVARRVGYKADLDDLKSIGRITLWKCRGEHDPETTSFEAFARRRLRYAMLDEVRRMTHHRTPAARALAVLAASDVVIGSGAPDTGQADPAFRLRAALEDKAVAMGFSLLLSKCDLLVGRDDSVTPEEATQRKRRAELVRDCVARLEDERQRQIINRYFFDGVTLDEIARELDISKSWASRTMAKALRLLMTTMPAELGEAAT